MEVAEKVLRQDNAATWTAKLARSTVIKWIQKMRLFLLAFLSVAFLTPCSWAFAETLHGHVVAVADGDTITILTVQKEQIKVRLTEIDAPEKDQPYGQKSKQALSDLVFKKDVKVTSDATDRYGRTLGRVFVNDNDVNLYMAVNGHAWAYTKYLTDPSIKEGEDKARDSFLGLWGLQADQIMPPWEWRRAKRQ